MDTETAAADQGIPVTGRRYVEATGQLLPEKIS